MMARKPPPALPDVFAKPGGAPPRGTPLEDLPQTAEPEAEILVQEPEPERAAPPPPPPPPIIAPVRAEPVPPRIEEPYVSRVQPQRAPRQRGVAIAIVALAVSLTAPFWEDSVLASLGI